MPRKSNSNSYRQKILELHRSGKSLEEIAEYFNHKPDSNGYHIIVWTLRQIEEE